MGYLEGLRELRAAAIDLGVEMHNGNPTTPTISNVIQIISQLDPEAIAKRIAELEDMLDSVQWSYPSSPSAIQGRCPRCARDKDEGHNEVCGIAAALADLEGK